MINPEGLIQSSRKLLTGTVSDTEIGPEPRTGITVYAPNEAVGRYGTARLLAQTGMTGQNMSPSTRALAMHEA